MQLVENKYIADKGKVFQRISDGFNDLETPIGYFSELILGQILFDKDGNKLLSPIPDKVEYYEEIELPKDDKIDKKHTKATTR